MASPGRNDPCPCGSGRKDKHCGRRAVQADETARVRLRAAEGARVPALTAYALDTFGGEFFEAAWRKFFLWDNVPDDTRESPKLETRFVLEQSASRTLRKKLGLA